ncbi:hypothetical protein ACM9HO_03335 [Pseudomonas sp. KHB2.9]
MIRQQNISERLLAESQRQASAARKKVANITRSHRKNVAHNEALIKALRDRMSPDLFLAVTEYVHTMENREFEK